MGREKKVYSRDNCHFYLLSALNTRLRELSKNTGWSKTKIVEDALFVYLNMVEKDLKGSATDGLAQVK